MCFQPVMPNSVMPDSVMLNSYLMLYHIPLYHFPLYLIPDCPLECYNRFLFSVIPDSIISDSVIPDSCFDIPDSVMPNSSIPDSSFACYNRFRYTRFPAPVRAFLVSDGRRSTSTWRCGGNFSHKTAKVSIFHARKNVRSEAAETTGDGSGSSKCVTRARG